MAKINVFGTLHNVTGEPIAKAAQIVDDVINKTQAEINQIALAGGFRTIDLEEEFLPEASAETTQKIYLRNSDNTETRNVKEEWITLVKNVVTYDGDEYPITDEGTAHSIITSTPSNPVPDGRVVLVAYSTQIAIDSEGIVTSGLGVYQYSFGDWQQKTTKLGDAYTVNGTTYVCTSDGWTLLSEIDPIYYWEMIGSKPVNVEPISSAQAMWQPIMEIFVDAQCTTKPSESVSTVYVRLNRSIDAGKAWGNSSITLGAEGEIIWCGASSLAVAFVSDNISLNNGVIASGVYTLSSGGSARDIIGWPTEFYDGGLAI